MATYNASANLTTGILQQHEKMFVNSHNLLHADEIEYQKINIDTKLTPNGYGRTEVKLAVNDSVLNENILEHISITSYHEEVSKYCQEISRLFGRPDNVLEINNSAFPANINTALNNVFKALTYLQATPDDFILKSNLKDATEVFASMVRDISKDLNNMSSQIHQNIDDSTDVVNQYLKQIHDINRVVITADDITRSTLEAQRNMMLEKVSEHIAVSTIDKGRGQVYVYTSDQNMPLVEQDLYNLEYTGDVYMNPDNTPVLPDDLRLVVYSTKNSLYRYDLSMDELNYGGIKGLYDVEHNDIRDTLFKLNSFAQNFASEYNKLYNQGISVPGKSSLTSSNEYSLSDQLHYGETIDVVLLNKRTGDAAKYADGSSIKPLSIDLDGVNVGDIIKKINNYFKPISTQVVFAENVRDVLLSVDEIENNTINFGMSIDSIRNQDLAVFVEDVTISYNANGIEVDSMESINHYDVIERLSVQSINNLFSIDRSQLPTSVKQVTAKVKMNVNGMESTVFYDIYFNDLYQDKYVGAVKADGLASVHSSNDPQYLRACLLDDEGKKITDRNLKGNIEIQSLQTDYAVCLSSSEKGSDNFLTDSQFASFFSVSKELHTAASSFSIDQELSNNVMAINTAEIKRNDLTKEYSVGPGNNLNILRVLSIQTMSTEFLDQNDESSYLTFNSFLGDIIVGKSQKSLSAASVYDVNSQYLVSLQEHKYNISGVNIDEILIEQKNITHISQSLMKAWEIYNEQIENLINLI